MIRKLSVDEISARSLSLEEARNRNFHPVSVVLENIRSLYNVGAMFRTSDGAGIERLYICGYTAHPPRKEIDKTALGSTESVPWEWRKSPVEVIEELRGKGYQIVSLEHTDRSVPFNEARYKFPLCLIIGNEVDGVSAEAVSMSDLAVEIPMHGIKQSLNVAVAYGIAVYGIVDIYRKNGLA